MSASLVVERLTRWRGLLDFVPVRADSVAMRQLKRELDAEIANARVLLEHEEAKQ